VGEDVRSSDLLALTILVASMKSHHDVNPTPMVRRRKKLDRNVKLVDHTREFDERYCRCTQAKRLQFGVRYE
jgi:hypothetical protein